MAGIQALYAVSLPLFFLVSGLAARLDAVLAGLQPQLGLFVFTAIAAGMLYLLSLPLDFCRSFLLERSFGLSRQSPGQWLGDWVKGACISFMFSIAAVQVFYAALKQFPASWWLVFAGAWLVFSLAIAFVFPALVVPLFFTYKPLRREELRQRVRGLADGMGVPVRDAYEIDLGKKTVKANAGLIGWGPLKRVVVSDTMFGSYTDDEIEVILAHELAHQKYLHVFIMIGLDAALAAAGLYGLFAFRQTLLSTFGIPSLLASSAIPLYFLYALAAGILASPLKNWVSRSLERQADAEALRVTGKRAAFVSSMRKLGEQNRADTDPHPLIRLIFFDHPSVSERIAYGR